MMSIPAAVVLDQYAPSMPSMVNQLHTTTASVQLSISIYLLTCGISTLFWGPLSDRFGRRRITLVSMPIFLLGSLFCIFANHIGILLFGRAVQGIGVSSCSFLGAAIMSDVFEGRMLNRVSSYFSATYSLVPIIAPVVGGYLQKWYGWRMNFIFLFALILAFYLIFLFAFCFA